MTLGPWNVLEAEYARELDGAEDLRLGWMSSVNLLRLAVNLRKDPS